MTPTSEQLAIIEAARTTKDNLLVNALAGAAKTTTLQLICEAVTGIPILSLAFNKKIAEEMAKRLPSHVKCQTLNSLGHGVWMRSLGKRVTLDFNKTGNFVKAAIDKLPKSEKTEAYEFMGSIIRAIGLGKSYGYIPDGAFSGTKGLIGSADFFSAIEEDFDDPLPGFAQDLVDAALIQSVREAFDGLIDFADQLYMPTLFGGTFPAFPLVLIDEAQDLSPLNHAMLRKLARTRLIAVGDPFQSIYGFRGAVSDGMTALQREFNMTSFTLSISFRCPEAIVQNVRWRAPHMQAFKEGGTVTDLQFKPWALKDIPENCAIICRNNAPLFSMAISLIKKGRGIQLLGSDIGPGLIKILKKFGPDTLTQAEVNREINRWQDQKLVKAKNPGAIEDKADCLRVFADSASTLRGAIAFAEALFKSAGTVQLMSGHKSKGLEFDTVIHLDSFRVPSKYAHTREAREQENNVRYVIDTRAKQTLIYANLEDFV